MGNCWHKLPRAVAVWTTQPADPGTRVKTDRMCQRVCTRLNPDASDDRAVWYQKANQANNGYDETYVWSTIGDGAFADLFSMKRSRTGPLSSTPPAATAEDIDTPVDSDTDAAIVSQWIGGVWVEQSRFEVNPGVPLFDADYKPFGVSFQAPSGSAWYPMADGVPFDLTYEQASDPDTEIEVVFHVDPQFGADYDVTKVLTFHDRLIEPYAGEQTSAGPVLSGAFPTRFGVGLVERLEFQLSGDLPCFTATYSLCRNRAGDDKPLDVRLFAGSGYDLDTNSAHHDFFYMSFYSHQSGLWTPVGRPAAPVFPNFVPGSWQNSVAGFWTGEIDQEPFVFGDKFITVTSVTVL